VAVRNHEKAHPGLPVPKRKQFRGDPAGQPFTHNPEPLPGSRRLKPGFQKAKAKVPQEVLVGKACMTHLAPKDRKCPFKGHCIDENRIRWVSRTKAHKAGCGGSGRSMA